MPPAGAPDADDGTSEGTDDGPDDENKEAAAMRALVQAAKQKPGMHFSRGGGGAGPVLRRLDMS